ncbi:hypothetical protein HU200_002862 [Digitaria exilis]|uniref:Xylanase inhibitor N-terminal domain-containing protein n=1 Tax=Digitaria exilis TaxID=1010633 RepID=A0A835KTK4_9POAL|nr:hypothetical protein HU200_002862 [Digitaria exilis]
MLGSLVVKISLTFSGGATTNLDVPNGILVNGCLAFADSGLDGTTGVLGNVNQRTFEVLFDTSMGNWQRKAAMASKMEGQGGVEKRRGGENLSVATTGAKTKGQEVCILHRRGQRDSINIRLEERWEPCMDEGPHRQSPTLPPRIPCPLGSRSPLHLAFSPSPLRSVAAHRPAYANLESVVRGVYPCGVRGHDTYLGIGVMVFPYPTVQ